MQKLKERNTYTPTNTSHVRSNCDLSLNREETLSVPDLKTSSNNPEETQLQHKGEQDSRVLVNVYVLSRNSKPLMPTSPGKAARLLKTKKAKVIKRCPFTIQLFGPCGESIQEIICGIDSGYENIGFCCVSEKKVIIIGEVKLEKMMKRRLDERRMYRRSRRNKLWYRKPRFLNRATPKGWLSPSTQRRFDTHIALIERLKKILPISKIIIEVAKFDIKKIDEIECKKTALQQNNFYNYTNIRNYIFAREEGVCQFCQKLNGKFQLHHIIPRSKGGTNKSNNLALLHKTCHNKLHKNNLESLINKSKQYKASTFMNIICKRFQDLSYEITYGYITSVNRNNLNIEKSHSNDAFIIAGGTIQEFSQSHQVVQKRKNNRSLQLNRKGFKPSIRKTHYVNQPHDLIVYKKNNYVVLGTHNYGRLTLVKDEKGNKKDIKTKELMSLYHSNGLVWKLI